MRKPSLLHWKIYHIQLRILRIGLYGTFLPLTDKEKYSCWQDSANVGECPPGGIGYGFHRYVGPKPPKGKKHTYRFTVYLENLQRLLGQPPVPEDGEFSESDIDKYVFGVRVYEDRFEWLLN